jgi:hypothetical protein
MKFHPDIPVFGNASYRGECPPESAEQITFFNNLPHDLRSIAIHPRNEGKRSYQQARWQKADGTITSGASDIIIPGSPAFVCELKRLDHTKSKWQPNQIDYLIACKSAGCFVCVALGWEAAFEAIKEWRSRFYN